MVMCTQSPARVPTPRPKLAAAGPAAIPSFSSDPATAPSTRHAAAAHADPGARRGARHAPADPLSDRATVFLIRRTLCPQQLDKSKGTPAPVEDLLPPLTSRNDVDLQLYALISIILREYVQSWYSRITPDETFVAEIVQIIAHCTRALEERLRKVDLEGLFFDEIPDLVDKHVKSCRAAKSTAAQPPLQANAREIYHSMWPLPALFPVPRPDSPSTIDEQAKNEAAYRQLLVHGVLAVLLPTEDLENGCLVALVGQILSELIIGNLVAERLSEPWMIWECLIILTRIIRERQAGDAPEDPPPQTDDHARKPRYLPLETWFWSLVQWCFVAAAFLRILATAVLSSGSLPRRASHSAGRHADTSCRRERIEPTDALEPHTTQPIPAQTPILSFRIFSTAGNLIEMDVRMPWLSGALSLLQWIAIAGPGRVAAVDGPLDRILSHSLIRARLLDPASLAPLLRAARGALFPNNAPGKPSLSPPASDAALRTLRRRAAAALRSLVPAPLARLYYLGRGPLAPPWRSAPASSGPSDDRGGASARASGAGLAAPARDEEGGWGGQELEGRHILEEIETGVLDVFGDAYCNKHLMYSILELILVRLMPELAERGTVELWEERLS